MVLFLPWTRATVKTKANTVTAVELAIFILQCFLLSIFCFLQHKFSHTLMQQNHTELTGTSRLHTFSFLLCLITVAYNLRLFSHSFFSFLQFKGTRVETCLIFFKRWQQLTYYCMKSKYIWEEFMMPVESARGRLSRLENARGRKFFFVLPPFFFR